MLKTHWMKTFFPHNVQEMYQIKNGHSPSPQGNHQVMSHLCEPTLLPIKKCFMLKSELHYKKLVPEMTNHFLKANTRKATVILLYPSKTTRVLLSLLLSLIHA